MKKETLPSTILIKPFSSSSTKHQKKINQDCDGVDEECSSWFQRPSPNILHRWISDLIQTSKASRGLTFSSWRTGCIYGCIYVTHYWLALDHLTLKIMVYYSSPLYTVHHGYLQAIFGLLSLSRRRL